MITEDSEVDFPKGPGTLPMQDGKSDTLMIEDEDNDPISPPTVSSG